MNIVLRKIENYVKMKITSKKIGNAIFEVEINCENTTIKSDLCELKDGKWSIPLSVIQDFEEIAEQARKFNEGN